LVNQLSSVLAQGGTIEKATAVLAGSEEYFTEQGGGTNDGFLDALYRDILNRPIDDAMRAAFDQKLASGTSRSEVAAMVIGSPEARQVLVHTLYTGLLGPGNDTTTFQLIVSGLDQGSPIDQVIAVLLASDGFSPPDPPVQLNKTDVQTLLDRASAATPSQD